MTVKQVSLRAGVSVRTLQYYDRLGLLCPTERTQAGYRLYDEASLDRLRQIMLFRELGFPLSEISRIMTSPGYDRAEALDRQITLLTMRKERLEGLIALAQNIRNGENNMDFSAFDTKKLDDYARQAKERWGETDAYREYEEKSRGRSTETEKLFGKGMMDIFAEFGALRGSAPDSPEALALAEKLRGYITANYYTCTPQIMQSLGQMYAAGGEFTENIDAVGGEGTAQFAADAIAAWAISDK